MIDFVIGILLGALLVSGIALCIYGNAKWLISFGVLVISLIVIAEKF